jgi:ABC-2 type transport system ATP-binding protein
LSDAAIEIVGLVKRFGHKVAVGGVGFTVDRGQCFGLIGPNGAGKTTTFSVICGYLFPNAGRVRVLGRDPALPGALKNAVGVLPQDAVLPPSWGVGELLTYWARLQGLADPVGAAKQALARVDLSETWRVRAGALSHGMARRVGIAQALMGEPPVVLLDEPTAGLDPRIAAQVRELVRSMKGTQTVVISSHNLQELEELCDAVAVLDKGLLRYAGPTADLTARSGEFRVLIPQGPVPLDVLGADPAYARVHFDEATRALVVEYDGKAHPPEEVISRALATILAAGGKVSEVRVGRRLEEKVLQLT